MKPKFLPRLLPIACSALLLMTAHAKAQQGRWSELPALPAPVSGHFAGHSQNALLTFGGANFPVPLFEGGTKKWVAAGNALATQSKNWRALPALPQPLAYGASVSDNDGLICIGGGDADSNTSAVFRLSWKAGTLCRTDLPDLPKTCANMSAALLGRTIYVSGGQETPTSATALHNLWALDLKNLRAGWRELTPPPSGVGRILPAMTAQDGALYLISGASLSPDDAGKPVRKYLQDAWRYEPKRGWKRLAPPPWATVAAPSAAAGKSQILVFGGSDGKLDARVQELKDAHPGFHREVLSYDTRRDAWRVVGQMPVSLVTTNAVKLGRDIIIPGGEDRPGHRNPRVLKFAP